MLKVGQSVGMLCKVTRGGVEKWELLEDKITKIVMGKKGTKYHTKSKFRPLDAEDVDDNTEIQEDAKGCILTREVFGLNDITRPKVEAWVTWANENMSEAVGILSTLGVTMKHLEGGNDREL